MHADKPVEILAYRLTQLHKTRIGGILRLALQYAVYTRLAERLGGDEVGLAHAERDAILAGCGNLEELSYAGGLHISCYGIENFCVIYHNSPLTVYEKILARNDLLFNYFFIFPTYK